MPKAAHYRLTFGGVFGTKAAPYEQWQFGLNVAAGVPTTVETFPTDPTLLGLMAPIRTAFVNNLLGTRQSGVRFTFLDVRFIGSDGKQPRGPDGAYVGAARLEFDEVAGASGPPKYPFQIAQVVTLDSNRSGPRGRGRVFLPPPANALEEDGRLSAGLAGAAVNGVVSVVNATNGAFAAIPEAADVSVMSTFGTISRVERCRAGLALDTHRSRRRDVQESYTPPVGVNA